MIKKTNLQKWQLILKEDVSPSKWFPLEKRSYKLPDGSKVDNFFVTTLSDSAHIISMTPEKKIVMIRMYKQGTDEIMIQFPAGRVEEKHEDNIHAAQEELAEETGIQVSKDSLEYFGKFALMSTKATETAHFYFAKDVEVSTDQNLDKNEEIEVLFLDPEQVEQMITDGEIWDAVCIAGWDLFKKKYGRLIP